MRAKLWLTLGPRTLFGEGKAKLLDLVDELGSLRQAAQAMGMSYRHAWGLLRELDAAAGFAFLEHGGGGVRGRLRLTPEGRRFVAAYRAVATPLHGLVKRRFERVFAGEREHLASRTTPVVAGRGQRGRRGALRASVRACPPFALRPSMLRRT